MSSVWLRTRASLIAHLRSSGNEAKWSEFYSIYWGVIYGYGKRYGLSDKDTEDLVQEVFIKVFRRLPSFEYDRRKGRFLSWLKTITRTTVIDWARRRAVRVEGQPQVEPREGGADPLLQIADPNAETEPDPWQEEWQRSLLAVALERLRSRVDSTTFEAFKRYAIQGEPAGEVAASLGLSRSAVYVYRNRLVKILQDEVAVLENEV